MGAAPTELTLGPNLFNWAPETWRDFYFRIADEAPSVGRSISAKPSAPSARRCSPTIIAAVGERLRAAGKTVVHSTLGETASKIDRRLVSEVCEQHRPIWSRPTTLRRRSICAGGLTASVR